MKISESFYSSILAGLLIVAAATGCGHREEPKATATALPVANVRVVTVQAGTRMATEDVVGTVRSRLRATIEAKVTGRIGKMRAVSGQPVKAGELLVEIDAQEVQAKLDQAMATHEQAAGDLKRLTALLRLDAATQQEFDAAQARARVSQAAVAEAKTILGYARVTAPFDGVITRKATDEGDLAAPGKPLLEIENPSSLRLEAEVPEAIIGKVHLADEMAVRIPAIEADLPGKVSEISPAANPISRTFLVKLELPSHPNLRAGLFGRVSVPVGEDHLPRVPVASVIARGQMEIVFVATNGIAQLRLVKTGKRIGDEIELLSGVEAGERVVVEGAPELRDGQAVRAE